MHNFEFGDYWEPLCLAGLSLSELKGERRPANAIAMFSGYIPRTMEHAQAVGAQLHKAFGMDLEERVRVGACHTPESGWPIMKLKIVQHPPMQK